MPLKIHVAMSRKVGEPNYGSRGASVGFELEAEASLVEQPQQLQERIAYMFRLAKQSVDLELGVANVPAGTAASQNGANARRNAAVRFATPAQVRAIHALAGRGQLDLVAELRNRFHVNRPEELSLAEASELIGDLKTSSDAT